MNLHPPMPDLPHDRAYQEMMRLFEELTFSDRMRRMFAGLPKPRESGEHKFAVLQLQRLSAPFCAVIVPLTLVLLMLLFRAQPEIRTPPSWFDVTPDPRTDPPMDPLPPIVNTDPPADPTALVNHIVLPPVAHPPQPPTPPGPPDAPPEIPKNPLRGPIPWNGLPGSDTLGRIREIAQTEGHGDPRGEEAVLRALRWLKQNQLPDGSWPKNKDAMTGLAVLSFLAHAERPGESREFGDTVQAGIQYLLRSQRPDGSWPGNYQHPIATYALCEAYGMTHNPIVRASAEKAVRIILAGQHASGGWDYGMKQTNRDDTSVMGWAAQALKAAQVTGVLDDPAMLDTACHRTVLGFLQNADPNGGFGYTGKGRGGLSAVGTLCLQFHGAGNHPQVRRTLDLMDGWRLAWKDPVVPGDSPQYYFYYATQAKFQTGKDTPRWKAWNAAMVAEYPKAQKVLSQEQSGYRDADGQPQGTGWWENGDHHSDRPVMDTCLAALQLMVYYRHLPTLMLPVLDATVVTSDSQDVPVAIQF